MSWGYEQNSADVFAVSTLTNALTITPGGGARSGAYGARAVGTGTRGHRHTLTVANSNAVYYMRIYFRAIAFPSAETTFFHIQDSGSSSRIWQTIDASGVITLKDEDGTIGSSSAIPLNTWVRIELYENLGGAGATDIITARIDGTDYATSSTRNITTGINAIDLGANLKSEGVTGYDFLFDDIAINNTSGTLQNSWPDEGEIVYLRPQAEGTASMFATIVGGAANNYSRINELSPDSATSYNGSSTLDDEDFFIVADPTTAGIVAGDTINVVSVGVQYRNDVADATAAFKVQLKTTSGGTVYQSAAVIPNSTSWVSNAAAAPRLYPITLDVDPDGNPWTVEKLRTTQIGYKITTAGTNRIDISNIWLLVDYTPGNVSPTLPTTISRRQGFS